MNTCLLGLPPEEALALAGGQCFDIVRTGGRAEADPSAGSDGLYEDRVVAVRDNCLVVSRFRVRLCDSESRRP